MKTYYMFGDSLMRGVMPDEAWNYHSSDAIGFEKMQAQYKVFKFCNADIYIRESKNVAYTDNVKSSGT